MTSKKYKRWLTVFENELAVLDGIKGIQKYDDDQFALATKAGDYLPRLQLMTSNSEKCKTGKFPVNNYALVSGENMQDCGRDVDILVISWRPKALEMGEQIITVYDPKNTGFVRIQDKSNEKDSGCMFGPEFLVWVPSQKKFGTFFMGSKSSRREAPNVKALMRKPATLKSHLIETAKYSWVSPTVVPCSTPFEMPDVQDLQDEVEKFMNPPATEIEKIEPNKQASSERAR